MQGRALVFAQALHRSLSHAPLGIASASCVYRIAIGHSLVLEGLLWPHVGVKRCLLSGWLFCMESSRSSMAWCKQTPAPSCLVPATRGLSMLRGSEHAPKPGFSQLSSPPRSHNSVSGPGSSLWVYQLPSPGGLGHTHRPAPIRYQLFSRAKCIGPTQANGLVCCGSGVHQNPISFG